MQKRIFICLIVSVLLAAALMPMSAFAAGADKSPAPTAESLGPPTGIRTSSCLSGILIQWNAQPDSLYVIQRSPSKDGAFITIAKVSGHIYIDNTAKIGENYFYKVCTLKDNALSAPTMAVAGRQLDPNKPMVAITYDDGPNPETTPIVLDAAEKCNARATFFVLGNRLSEAAPILQRTVSLGCEIGSHGWNHTAFSSLSGGGLIRQQNNTSARIEAAVGFGPKISRPPYGSLSGTARRNSPYPYIMWSVDTLDWRHRNISKTLASVMSAEDGDIILMHDIHMPTAEAAELIFTELHNKGIQTATVSELAYYRGIFMQRGQKYFSMPAQ